MHAIPIILSLLAAAGQGDAPRDTPLVFFMQDGSRLYGFSVREDKERDVWLIRYNLFGDTTTAKTYKHTDILGWELEEPEKMKERFAKSAKEAGLVEVPPGQYIPQEEFDLAQRATEMAREVEARLHPTETDPVAEPNGDEPTEPAVEEQPSPIRRWGPQAGLIVAALVLIGIVTKSLLLGDRG